MTHNIKIIFQGTSIGSNVQQLLKTTLSLKRMRIAIPHDQELKSVNKNKLKFESRSTD